MCDTCGSQHNFRGGHLPQQRPSRTEPPTVEAVPERMETTVTESSESHSGETSELERLLRRVLREETGWTPTAPAEKWRGGELVLRPGKPGLQEKTMPIDALFHKVIMVRNKLRVLEQQVNGSDIPDHLKLKLQSYITGCYGSLTSLNVLFASDEDRFRGSST